MEIQAEDPIKNVHVRLYYSSTPIKRPPLGKWIVAVKGGWPLMVIVRGENNRKATIRTLITSGLMGMAI